MFFIFFFSFFPKLCFNFDPLTSFIHFTVEKLEYNISELNFFFYLYGFYGVMFDLL